MLFTNLSSEVIKTGIIQRLAFSVGFKAIAAGIKAKKPLPLNFETGEKDYTPIVEAGRAKKAWAVLVEFAATYDYKIESIEVIAEKYCSSSNKPVVKADAAMLARRAKIAGASLDSLSTSNSKKQEIAQAVLKEKVNAIVADFSDIAEYANDWYTQGDLGDIKVASVDIEEILTDEWVSETYPKIVKSQVAFWTRYNNWDDVELIFIEADQELLV